MKKIISTTIASISALSLLLTSNTAFACGGGEMTDLPAKTYTKENSQTYTSKKSKNSVVITSKPSTKSIAKVFVDGVDTPISPKGKKSEKELILDAVKEISCAMAKDPLWATEENIEAIFKKYGLNELEALEAKYENDTEFEKLIEKTIENTTKNCGGKKIVQ